MHYVLYSIEGTYIDQKKCLRKLRVYKKTPTAGLEPATIKLRA